MFLADRFRLLVGGSLLLLAVIGLGYFGFQATTSRSDGPLAADGLAATISGQAANAHPELLTIAPDNLQPLSPVDAQAWNKRLPFADGPIRPVAPFIVRLGNPDDYQRAVDCLSAAIHYEAANESFAGRLAVAQVVLNRARHPLYPRSVCGVVFEGSDRRTGCQFSFTCDGAMSRRPSASSWASATTIAEAALNGVVSADVGPATHYHADYAAPYWAERLSKLVQIGTHIFYRFPGSWSDASALRRPYTGIEPVIAKMADLSRVIDPGLELVEDPVASETVPTTDLYEPVAPRVETSILSPLPRPAGPDQSAVASDNSVVAEPAPPVVQNPLVAPNTRRSRIARPTS